MKNDEQLVTVYSLGNPAQAEIVKNALEAEGIRCFLDGINQAGEAGLTAFEIKVQVASGDAGRARKMIRYHEAHAKA